MPRQGSPSGKRLAASSVSADIRPLARVNAAVSSQRRRVAKRLVADIALVGLFASVHPHVHRQGRPLDKLLSAHATNVGPHPSVDALVADQVAAS